MHRVISYSQQAGKKEGKNEIAANMKAEGMSMQDISKFTGLSIQEIEHL